MDTIAERVDATFMVRVARYEESHRAAHVDVAVEAGVAREIALEATVWEVLLTIAPVAGEAGAEQLVLTAKLVRGEAGSHAVSLVLAMGRWSMENYVLLPAAAYGGNRFECIPLIYPPKFKGVRNSGPATPPAMNDVPRLTAERASRIQQLAGDLATPAVGVFDGTRQTAMVLLTGQTCSKGSLGIDLEEALDRKTAAIRITAPGVREDAYYHEFRFKKPSPDRAAKFAVGESVTITARLFVWRAEAVGELFAQFLRVRKSLSGPTVYRPILPMSAAFAVMEEKYNRENWKESGGYYRVGTNGGPHSDWQAGWVGGLMSTLPMLSDGEAVSRERARRTFDYALGPAQAPSGLLYGVGVDDTFFGDNFAEMENKAYGLIRKSADVLYFAFTQLALMRGQGMEVKAAWVAGARRCANAFVRLWTKYGQFGQFLDIEKEEIIVGGSVSAGTAPGGLALAAAYLGEAKYLEVAKEAARMLYETWAARGIMNGGPGEILSAPDSESSFGLLESMVTIYEATREPEFLRMAEDVAAQCATWVMSYDFAFPAGSTFGKMDMRACGAVFANVQNKHGAPGICTLSGASLLRLYRATGNRLYLELLQDIAHNMTQYLSIKERPIGALHGKDKFAPPGYMNERVQTCDWLEPVGEMFYGSCWSEISCMLTFAEVPGVYAQPDTGLAVAFDNVQAAASAREGGRAVLRVTNPTKFDAVVKVFAEPSGAMGTPLGVNFLARRHEKLAVKAGETRELLL